MYAKSNIYCRFIFRNNSKQFDMKVSFLLVMLCAIFFTPSVHSQTSLYEFDYRFVNDTTEYKAFLVRNLDATGFLRISFRNHADKTPVIVHLDLNEHYDKFPSTYQSPGGIRDTTILCFEGENPKIIFGHKDFKFDPDIFRFKKNEKTGMFDPLEVLSPDPESFNKVTGKVSQMKLLNKSDLTKELVSQFFLEDEDFYVNLFKLKSRSLTNEEKATQLYLVLVANTRDASIGKTCIVDKVAITDTYQSITEFLGIGFVLKEVSDTAFNKANVQKALDQLKPESKDIVVFYYTGHGYCDTTDSRLFPYLDLRDKKFQRPGPEFSLNMEDIYRSIKSKGAHINLVFSDCCNSPIGNAPIHIDKVPSTRVSSLGWVKNNCQALFLAPSKYSLLMTASSKKEESSGNDNEGGIFTFNLRETLEKYMGPQHTGITWDQVLTEAQKQTIIRIARGLCPVPEDPTQYRDCKQRPLFKIN